MVAAENGRRRHHRQRVGAVDEGRGGHGLGVEAGAALAPDDLEPDDGEQADRRRPAAQPLRVAGVGGALAGDQAEARSGGAADRPPGVEGPEEVAEDRREEREAEPAGDEEEGEGEVAVGRFGALEAGVDRQPEEEDADRAAERLHRQGEEDAREPRPERPLMQLLEAGAAPACRQREEGDDQDDRSPPGEEPGRDRQVLPGCQGVRQRQEAHGLTRSSAICTPSSSSSAS